MLVHAYLMYAFPSQTVQETVDSLEMVRQLFENEVIQSGFWHHFALTAHSPIGLDPDRFGIQAEQMTTTFAKNDVPFTDQTGIDHNPFSYGLRKSLLNYMNGIGFDLPLQKWFDFRIPPTTIGRNFIENCLKEAIPAIPEPTSNLYWMGGRLNARTVNVTKKGKSRELLQWNVHDQLDQHSIRFDPDKGRWLTDLLEETGPFRPIRFDRFRALYEERFDDFDLFWFSKSFTEWREIGLIVL
jgi:hypothetical protein